MITRTQVINWKTGRLHDLATRIETENQLYLDQLDRAKKVFTDSQSYWLGAARDAAYDRIAQDHHQGYQLFLEVGDTPAVLRAVASALESHRSVLLGKVTDALEAPGSDLSVNDTWQLTGSADLVNAHQELVNTAYRELEAAASAAIAKLAEHAEYIRAAGDLLGSGLDVADDRSDAAATRLAAEDGAALAAALRDGDHTTAAAIMAHLPKGVSAKEIADISAGKYVAGVPTDTQQYYRDFNNAFYRDPGNTGNYKKWMENAQRQDVTPATIVDIARTHEITPEDFTVLDGMEPVTDKDGKTYFLVPDGTSGDDAKKAVLMTYILNAGTDYDAAGQKSGVTNDFKESPYSSTEVQRIIDRQNNNPWTYSGDVGFVNANGGQLATTPNGMMMGLGGNMLQDVYSQKGGTTYGDIFMFNIDNPTDPAAQMRKIIDTGTMHYEHDDGIHAGQLDLDRLLHHEERHSQQWADKGYFGMIWAATTDSHGIEEDAGLSDGGYK